MVFVSLNLSALSADNTNGEYDGTVYRSTVSVGSDMRRCNEAVVLNVLTHKVDDDRSRDSF